MASEDKPENQQISEKSIIVPVPNLPSPEVDPNIMSKWLEEEPNAELRRIKRKMADAVSNVPFHMFRKKLEEIGRKFNEAVGEKPYVVFWDTKPHGSKRWAYSLVEDGLEKPPRLATYIKKPEQIIKQLEKNGSDTIVIFDDAAYTGDQLSDSIYVPLWNHIHEVKYPKTLNMILCIPYTSKIFGYMVRKDWDDDTIHTELISSQEIHSLWDILTDREQDALREVNSRLNIPKVGDDPDNIRFQPVYFGSTTTTFDHKIPDRTSVCRPLLASMGIDLKTRREPYKVKGTPYYDLEKKEFGLYGIDLLST